MGLRGLGRILGWGVVLVILLLEQSLSVASVDPKAEVAPAIYAASATQAAAERAADAKLRGQRKEIEALRIQVQSGAVHHQAELTASEERYVAALAARDWAYAQEIAVFRKAVGGV